MLLENAKKTFNDIEKDFKEKNGKIVFAKVDKFLIEFIELVDKNFSSANSNLLSNIISYYIQAKQKQTVFKEILKWVGIYIEIMDNPDKSVYDDNPVKTI